MPGSSEATVRLPDGVALHARPAANFVRAAMGFESAIRLGQGERETDAKSLLGVLSLGAEGGSTVRLRADGSDAEAAILALAEGLRGFT
jgi:phosphotransferase system HPr (HPr) family protein